MIAREIVEMHGGQIWAESAVGMGSDFKFTIPIPAGTLEVLPPQLAVAKAA